MKPSVTKAFCAVFIALLFVALGSTAQTPKQQGCGNPPWFNPEGKCNNRQQTYIFASTVNWPERKETDCYLYIHVCSLVIRRNTKESLGAKCPEAKDFAQPTLCCDEFNKAAKSKQPCDPTQDADCDGLPNDKDPDPLGPRDSDTDNKCKQLGQGVYEAYLKAGANDHTAMQAAMADRHDCIKRRTDKNCGNPDPEQTSDSPPPYPKDPDTDNKCKQLGQDIYEIYLHAGANSDTATGAGQSARRDCYKSRASKM